MIEPSEESYASLIPPAERVRLRPTVDVRALERFLALVPVCDRRAMVLSFVSPLTFEDVRDVLMESPDPDAVDVLGTLMRTHEDVSVTLSDPMMRSDDAEVPTTLRFDCVPTSDWLVQAEPPADPSLRALWDAIEPRA